MANCLNNDIYSDDQSRVELALNHTSFDCAISCYGSSSFSISPLGSPCLDCSNNHFFDDNVEPKFLIGDRVIGGKERCAGVIAYVGPTHFSSLHMAGIVLDEEKGRHDGSIYGIRYFQCKKNHGIFCRLKTLRKDSKRQTGKCNMVKTSDISFTGDFNFFCDSSEIRRSKRIGSERKLRNDRSVLSVVGQDMVDEKSRTKGNLSRTASERVKSSAWAMARDRHKDEWQDKTTVHGRCDAKHPNGFRTDRTMGSSVDRDFFSQRNQVLRPSFIRVTDRRQNKARNSPCGLHQLTTSRPSVSFVENDVRRISITELLSDCRSTSSSYSDWFNVDQLQNSSGMASVRTSQSLDKRSSVGGDGYDGYVVDNVISCAQERLYKLMDELIKLHQIHAVAATELQSQKTHRQELTEAYEKKRNGAVKSSTNWQNAEASQQSSSGQGRLVMDRSQELSGLRYQQRLQYQTWVAAIADCLETVRSQLIEIRHSCHGKEMSTEALEEVRQSQSDRLREADEHIRHLLLQISVVNADLTQLRGRPEFETRQLLHKLKCDRMYHHEAEAYIEKLQQQVSFLQQEIERVQQKLSTENNRQFFHLQKSFRSQQLQHLQSKATDMIIEQEQLFQKKNEQLREITESLDFKSNAWAAERQLMIQTNNLLRGKLAQLVDTGEKPKPTKVSSQSDTMQRPFNRKHYRTLLIRKGSHALNSKSAERTLTHPFFGALCAEIRRLQTRAANLVDAIDTLNSEHYSEVQLESIKAYVYGTKHIKSLAHVVPHFCRKLLTGNDMVIPIAKTQSPLEDTSPLNQPKPFDNDRIRLNGQKPKKEGKVSNEEEFNNSCPPMRSAASPVHTRFRRYHMFVNAKRVFDPSLSNSIPEVDDECD